MASRQSLQYLLENLFGSNNVYYQAGTNTRMSYPAIRYARENIDEIKADNKTYIMTNIYQITVIDPRPDNPVIEKLEELECCSFQRHYIADNLHHYVFSLCY